ncbi:hypothetical protein Lal_00025112 [Lupinus albus]|nr:hypothetical protein Lal_00025112 [Lupinus albus]
MPSDVKQLAEERFLTRYQPLYNQVVKDILAAPIVLHECCIPAQDKMVLDFHQQIQKSNELNLSVKIELVT